MRSEKEKQPFVKHYCGNLAVIASLPEVTVSKKNQDLLVKNNLPNYRR